MSYYKSPEVMYARRAENFKKTADRHWAMAKNGEGGGHYGQARICYAHAAENQRRAENAKNTSAGWDKGK